MLKKECAVKGCNKVIEGYTKKHVEQLMKQHIIAKHPEDVKFDWSDKK